MKADLAIYTHVLGVPGQYESVALMLSHKMDFDYCANRDGFYKSSHICNFCIVTNISSDDHTYVYAGYHKEFNKTYNYRF